MICVALCAACWTQEAGSRTSFDEKARTLVISAPSSQDPALLQQNQLLHAEPAGLAERDVVVVHVVAGVVDPPFDQQFDAESLRQFVGLPSLEFGVALVGKDGSVKLRQSKPIDLATLFDTIDAMPMRQHEIRQHSN
jgi:hypothetical protein